MTTTAKWQHEGQSETSRQAWLENEPSAASQRGRVLRFLVGCGYIGATDEELQVALQMNPSTQRPRRIELVEGGWVRDSGKRGRTRSGRLAVIWVATDKALGR